MKCFECGSEMVEKRETVRDHALGLPNVVLREVPVRRCPKCREYEVVFPQMARLHKFLAGILIRKNTRLTGHEVRFLRKYLGWSGADLARRIGVTPESVSRWENEHEPIGLVPDRTLRLMVALEKPVDNYHASALEIITADDPKPAALNVAVKDSGYVLVDA